MVAVYGVVPRGSVGQVRQYRVVEVVIDTPRARHHPAARARLRLRPEVHGHVRTRLAEVEHS